MGSNKKSKSARNRWAASVVCNIVATSRAHGTRRRPKKKKTKCFLKTFGFRRAGHTLRERSQNGIFSKNAFTTGRFSLSSYNVFREGGAVGWSQWDGAGGEGLELVACRVIRIVCLVNWMCICVCVYARFVWIFFDRNGIHACTVVRRRSCRISWTMAAARTSVAGNGLGGVESETQRKTRRVGKTNEILAFPSRTRQLSHRHIYIYIYSFF